MRTVLACMVFSLSLFCSSIINARQVSSAITYRAAVIEYAGVYIPDIKERNVSRTEALESMMVNVQRLDVLMAESAQSFNPPQIFVWPEDSLYGPFNLGPIGPSRSELLPFCDTIPDVDSTTGGILACGNTTFEEGAPIVSAMACIAKKYNTYLVATVGDVHWCTNSSSSSIQCPPDGRLQYNTAVAVDPSGNLVARYHKTHLFQEVQWDAAPVNDVTNLAMFHTNFGVTFGICICFDLLFTWPVEEYIARGVTDFSVPIWWVNQDTLQTAGEAQQAWARAHNVNLLAANSGLSLNFSGSGIYKAGGEVLASQFNPTKEGISRVLVADVTSLSPSSQKLRGNFGVHRDASTKSHGVVQDAVHTGVGSSLSRSLAIGDQGSIVVFEALPGASNLVNVSDNGLFCSASYLISKTTPVPYSRYALFAYRGNFRGELVEEICAVTKCALPYPACIGWATDASTEFEELAVGGYFEEAGLRFEYLGLDGASLAPPDAITPYLDGVKLNRSTSAVLNLAVFNYPEIRYVN